MTVSDFPSVCAHDKTVRVPLDKSDSIPAASVPGFSLTESFRDFKISNSIRQCTQPNKTPGRRTHYPSARNNVRSNTRDDTMKAFEGFEYLDANIEQNKGSFRKLPLRRLPHWVEDDRNNWPIKEDNLNNLDSYLIKDSLPHISASLPSSTIPLSSITDSASEHTRRRAKSFSSESFGKLKSKLNSFLSFNEKKSDTNAYESQDFSADSSKEKGGSWKTLLRAHRVVSQFKNVHKGKDLQDFPKAESSLVRRNNYSVKRAKTGIDRRSHVHLERGRVVAMKELLLLKNYFDELDITGRGIVSKEEVATHMANKQLLDHARGSKTGDGSTFSMLKGLRGDISFEDVLTKSYPEYSKADIQLCLHAIHRRQNEHKFFDIVEDELDITKELKEVEQFFPCYSKEGAMTLHLFCSFLRTVNDFSTLDKTEKQYETIANSETGLIHRKEFTIFWINLFRSGSKQLLWRDIEPLVREFDESFDRFDFESTLMECDL